MASSKIEAIVTGKVWKIDKKEGDRLEAGDCIMILESMKMEIPIETEDSGTLGQLMVAEGDSVTEGQVVAVVER